jgi:hypothetical protein
MITTPRFVFLHLHKSGGTFVNELLLRFVDGAEELGYHLPRSYIPSRAANLPILGLVRNPWSYYVSWYAFQSARPQPNALFRVLSEEGRLDFAATVYNMLQLGTRDEHLAKVLQTLPANYTNHGLNLPRLALEKIRDSGSGFYSFLYRYMYGDTQDVYIERMEQLRDSLAVRLNSLGQEVTDEMRMYLANAPRRNESQHDSYVRYYDACLKMLVAERDAAVIRQHAYQFESD